MTTSFQLAVDVGGTFTDLVAAPEGQGCQTAPIRSKVRTTPGQFEAGVLDALIASSVPPSAVRTFIHGSTIVINAITERRGTRTAFVTTQGFKDILLIGRGNRPDLYNLAYHKPPPLVPRSLCYELAERMSHLGEVIEPLDEEQIGVVVEQLRHAGVGAVALCLLHSWANPAHEARAASLMRLRLPGIAVVASHEISGEWREYERSSTSVLSAYVQPAVVKYLESLRRELARQGLTADSFVMRSNGGVCTFDHAQRSPITLLESGPAAGVTAAAALGERIGSPHVLTLDIGGTTAKTSAVRNGRIPVRSLHHIEATPSSPGYPVQVPVVDITEIGAGGGSLARVDRAGNLHVGPVSAGAQPGPACYATGGYGATITDANLVAGWLNPEFFLGGAIQLDVSAAEKALGDLGRAIGTDAQTAARGVLRVGLARMANALRLVTLQRGHDPRDYAFVAFGGAGPVHAAMLARELGIRQVVIPPGPGHFSAFGMLAGEIRADAACTGIGKLEPAQLAAVVDRAERDARRELGSVGPPVRIRRYASLRYRGQEHTIEVPVPAGPIGPAEVASLRREFDMRSFELYAFSLSEPLELVGARATAAIPADAPAWTWGDGCGCGGREVPSRLVDFDSHGGRLETIVLDRCSLAPGDVLAGPCVIEETAATTLVLPGQVVHCDELGNLIVAEKT